MGAFPKKRLKNKAKPLKQEWLNSHFTVLGVIFNYLIIEAFVRGGITNKESISGRLRLAIEDFVFNVEGIIFNNEVFNYLGFIILTVTILIIFFAVGLFFKLILSKYWYGLSGSYILQLILSMMRLFFSFIFLVLFVNYF